MAWEGYIAVLDLVEFPYATPALDWDLGMVYLVFPLSFLLMAIRIVQVNVIKYILKEEILDPVRNPSKKAKRRSWQKETRNDGSPFPANIGLLLFGIFFVLLLIGSPIMVALGVATMACFIVLDIDLSLMIERAFASLTAFPAHGVAGIRPSGLAHGSGRRVQTSRACRRKHRRPHARRPRDLHDPVLRLLRRHFRLRPCDHGRRGYAHDPGHGQARL